MSSFYVENVLQRISKWCCVLGLLDEALSTNDHDLMPTYEELWPEGAIIFTNEESDQL